MRKIVIGWKSHHFTEKQIDAIVEEGCIGVYELGGPSASELFHIAYVGRSDTCLKTRLRQQLLRRHEERFRFRYCADKKAAFDMECAVWHDNPHLAKTQEHPDRPDGTNYHCPACGHPAEG